MPAKTASKTISRSPAGTGQASASQPPETTLLQPFVWPDPAICSERDLFVRLHGIAGLSQAAGMVDFDAGAHIQFDTYFNLFNLGKWRGHCGLDDLGLQLRGEGRIEVTVFLTFPRRSWVRLVNEVIELDPEQVQRLSLPIADHDSDLGIVFFEFRSLDAGRLTWAAWDTLDAPKRTPELALSVTTFRREKAVRRTVARFEKFAAGSRLGAHLRMIVVDNGRSSGLADTDKVTVIDNENYGGAGGFSRGLIAAREMGASHCLFMDDDASTPFDAVERTWMFLAYASDPATAIAGAMISTRHAWAFWENGALFDGACRPQHGGTDLRNPAQVFAVEYATTPRQPENFYGGWWYFAFPLAEVKHLPFPFFVRGDDVSFSLVHDFNIVTLPGVVSFQESFTEKDSPLTWYLDLRSHLVHHLALPAMDIGRVATLRIAIWFWARTFVTNHYETMAALNMAFADVIEGPEYFARNADVAARRAEIGKLRSREAWKDCAEPPAERRRFNPHHRWTRLLFKLTLNGHLLPGFKTFGNRLTLPPEQRWNVRESWGAAQITYFDPDKRKAYTVTQSGRAALRESWKLARLSWAFWRTYDGLKARWQKAYPEMTSDQFWARMLDLDKKDAA